MLSEAVQAAKAKIEPVRCQRCGGEGSLESFDFDHGTTRTECWICAGAGKVPNIAPEAVTHIVALLAEVEQRGTRIATLEAERDAAERERDAARERCAALELATEAFEQSSEASMADAKAAEEKLRLAMAVVTAASRVGFAGWSCREDWEAFRTAWQAWCCQPLDAATHPAGKP